MKKGCLAVFLAFLLAVLVATYVWRTDLGKLELSRFPTRASWQLPERVMEALAVKPGGQVADLGAGDGYLTWFLAEAVGPAGKVYAVDVDDGILDALEKEVANRKLTNVIVVRGGTDDPLLPDGEIDLVFLCNVYHHLSGHIAYFERLRGDLSARGRVAIVEPRDEGFSRLVNPPGHATSLDLMRTEMKLAGYAPEESFDFLPVQRFEIFAPLFPDEARELPAVE